MMEKASDNYLKVNENMLLELLPIKEEGFDVKPQISFVQRAVNDCKDGNEEAPILTGKEKHSKENISKRLVRKSSRQLDQPTKRNRNLPPCQVCSDVSVGYHCGTFICEACKKFFLRCHRKGVGENFHCAIMNQCNVSKKSRSHCQSCRYHKCLELNMYLPGTEKAKKLNIDYKSVPCKVCGLPSSGYHFGIITCEGCKGFFRRMAKEQEESSKTCLQHGLCFQLSPTKAICRYCRFEKCKTAGMSLNGSRMGRQSNSCKIATMIELQRQGYQVGPLPELPQSVTVPSIESQMGSQVSQKETIEKNLCQDEQNLLDDDREDLHFENGNEMKMGSKLTKQESGMIYQMAENLNEKNVSSLEFEVDIEMENNHSIFNRFSHKLKAEEIKVPAIPYKLSAMQPDDFSSKNLADVAIGKSAYSAESRNPMPDEKDEDDIIRNILENPLQSHTSEQLQHFMSLIECAFHELEKISQRPQEMDETVISGNNLSSVWHLAMYGFIHHTKCIVGFIKKLPGFNMLPILDRVKLCRGSVYPLSLAYHVQFISLETKNYNWFVNTDAEKKVILQCFPQFNVIADHFETIGFDLARMFFSKREKMFFMTALVYCIGNENYSNSQLVNNMKLIVLDFLKFVVMKHPDSSRFGKMLLYLEKLEQANAEHLLAVQTAQTDNPDVDFGSLWNEVFLTMKNEDQSSKCCSNLYGVDYLQ